MRRHSETCVRSSGQRIDHQGGPVCQEAAGTHLGFVHLALLDHLRKTLLVTLHFLGGCRQEETPETPDEAQLQLPVDAREAHTIEAALECLRQAKPLHIPGLS